MASTLPHRYAHIHSSNQRFSQISHQSTCTTPTFARSKLNTDSRVFQDNPEHSNNPENPDYSNVEFICCWCGNGPYRLTYNHECVECWHSACPRCVFFEISNLGEDEAESEEANRLASDMNTSRCSAPKSRFYHNGDNAPRSREYTCATSSLEALSRDRINEHFNRQNGFYQYGREVNFVCCECTNTTPNLTVGSSCGSCGHENSGCCDEDDSNNDTIF